MDLASLFFRVLDNKGDVYLPYSFEGEWTEQEKAQISAAIDPHVPAQVDAMFNNWRFSKYGNHFLGHRAWETGSFGGTLDNLTQQITEYYNR